MKVQFRASFQAQETAVNPLMNHSLAMQTDRPSRKPGDPAAQCASEDHSVLPRESDPTLSFTGNRKIVFL